MDSFAAFARGQEARRRGAREKVFDWDRAATLMKERGARNASAGLIEDWGWTAADILTNGAIPVGGFRPYLASVWATPALEIDDEKIECWKREEDAPEWSATTWWPASARLILFGDADPARINAPGSVQ